MPTTCLFVECPSCGLQYVLKKGKLTYSNGAYIERRRCSRKKNKSKSTKEATKYYVLRRGSQFNGILMEASLADLWRRAGWELGPTPFDSQYEAQLAIRALEDLCPEVN
jgi:hypothetical protein